MELLGSGFKGAYDVGNEIGAELGIKKVWRKAKKGVRGVKRGVTKGAKGVARGAKKAGKGVAKVSKKALMAAARLAARPIRAMFAKLAMRRARLLSWRRGKTITPTKAEKAAASAWALARMRQKGPIGRLGVKILRFTGGATLGGAEMAVLSTDAALVKCLRDWHREEHRVKTAGYDAETGMTGAEIAAAAAAIVGAIASIMKSLNKPGEAPADPRQGEEVEEEGEEGEEGE